MVGMATLPNINTTFRTTYTYSISSLWVQTTLTSWSVVKNNTSIATDLKKARAGIPIRKNPMTPNCANRQSYATRNTLVSYFGRLNYSLLNRYLFTFTMRWDGSSRFSKDNRWGTFPSLALGWKIKEENFLKDVNVLSDLKLRLGWGITGQQNIGDDFAYLPLYVVNNEYAQYPFGDTYYSTSARRLSMKI